MGDSQDSYQLAAINTVNEAVGITLEYVTSRPCLVGGPAEGCARHLLDGMVQLSDESLFGSRSLCAVPVPSRFHLPDGFRVEDDPATSHRCRSSASHELLPRECPRPRQTPN